MKKIKNYNLNEIFDDGSESNTYWVELAKIEFTEEICKCMEDKGVSRKDLAGLMGTSPAYITKMLKGNVNFTLETMVKVTRALGCELRCHIQPEDAVSTWFDLYDFGQEEAVNLDEERKHYSAPISFEIKGDIDGNLAATA